MPRAYSEDMRARVLAEVESGASRRAAAEEFDVSASTAIIWVKCFRETGRCTAKPRGGSVSPLEKHADFLLGLVARRPDLTLDEAVLAMHRHKIPGSRSSMWRFFKRHKIADPVLEDPVGWQADRIFDPLGFQELVDLRHGERCVSAEIDTRELALVACNDRLEHAVPAVGAVHAAGTQPRAESNARILSDVAHSPQVVVWRCDG